MPKLTLRDPKVKAGAAVIGAVIAYALYKRHQATAATGSSSDPTGAANALGDANLQDAVYQPLEGQIQDLAATVAQLQATSPSAPTPSSPQPRGILAQPPASRTKPITTPKPRVHLNPPAPAKPKPAAKKKPPAKPPLRIAQEARAGFLPGSY